MQSVVSLSKAEELEENGIAVLPNFLCQDQLASMRQAFEVRLRRMRWNDFDGYEKTERYRHMVQDVLTLDQGFVDAALHPIVKATLRDYLGNHYALCEAKGWKSLPTMKDFHGWHGDAWYDQNATIEIPREVKLGIYLSDVKSGAFHYIRGSHRKQAPKYVRNSEVAAVPNSQIAAVSATAGTAFLFDTSGVHRQGVPLLEERWAVFYNYHDPAVQLQKEDVDYYRYHPLLLNAAFLGGLGEEDERILGFGDKTNYVHAFERRPKHTLLQNGFAIAYAAKLAYDGMAVRIAGRLRRIAGRANS
jgi:hypothetical protein